MVWRAATPAFLARVHAANTAPLLFTTSPVLHPGRVFPGPLPVGLSERARASHRGLLYHGAAAFW